MGLRDISSSAMMSDDDCAMNRQQEEHASLMAAKPAWAQADSVQLCVVLLPILSANSSALPLGIHPMLVVTLPTTVLDPTPPHCHRAGHIEHAWLI